MANNTAPKMTVKALYVYPIKSLRGLSPPSLTATYLGFTSDRSFVLQDISKSTHMAVAEYTSMCLFTQHPSSTSPATCFEVRYGMNHAFDKPEQAVDKDDVLTIPYMPEIEGLEERKVDMHHSPTMGYDMGGGYNKWFSERFGYEVRLLFIGGNVRKVLGNMPPNVAGRQLRLGTRGEGLGNTAEIEGYGFDEAEGGSNGVGNGGWLGSLSRTVQGVVGSVVGGGKGGEDKENGGGGGGGGEGYDGVDRGITFADVAPYLVISTKSWENASRRLGGGEEMDISKFRPNIVVDGAEEDFEEDFWAELKVGEGKIVLTQNCARCNSLNVDYKTGKVGLGESGKMLKKLQKDRRVDLGAKYSPVFGRYGFLARTKDAQEKGAVELRVGDEVVVTKRNDERTRFEWPKLSTNN